MALETQREIEETPPNPEPAPPEFTDELLEARSSLEKLAMSLTNQNHAMADDLVQETSFRALKHWDQYEIGTNMKAWLARILHNLHKSNWRKTKWEVEDSESMHAEAVRVEPMQESALFAAQMLAELEKLSPQDRKLLTLVAEGTHKSAATELGIPVGTAKSQVSRIRELLREKLRKMESRKMMKSE
ncbi:MAG: sigma-70 family RNA polymerase sigma factor [Patescibacteria group bacterium]